MTCQRCGGLTRQANYLLCAVCKAELRELGLEWCAVCRADGLPSGDRSNRRCITCRRRENAERMRQAYVREQRNRSKRVLYAQERERYMAAGGAGPCARCGAAREHPTWRCCRACVAALEADGLRWCPGCNAAHDLFEFAAAYCGACTAARRRARRAA